MIGPPHYYGQTIHLYLVNYHCYGSHGFHSYVSLPEGKQTGDDAQAYGILVNTLITGASSRIRCFTT